MANTIEIKVPDIGGHDDVPVIEVLVKVGDTIEKEEPDHAGVGQGDHGGSLQRRRRGQGAEAQGGR